MTPPQALDDFTTLWRALRTHDEAVFEARLTTIAADPGRAAECLGFAIENVEAIERAVSNILGQDPDDGDIIDRLAGHVAAGGDL